MMYPTLSQHARRVLSVLKQGGVLDGFAIKARAGLSDNKQLAEALQPLFEFELIGHPGDLFTEGGVARAYYSIKPSMAGTVDSLLRLQPPGLSL